MTHPTRLAAAPPRRRSPRARRAAVLLLLCAAGACGKKGPPLAPIPRVPALVTTVTATRAGDDVYLSFLVPETNAGGQKPADLAKMEVYAVTAEHAPETEEQRKLATLIGTLPVRPILPPLPPLPDGSLPPPLPGLAQGATAVFKETLTDEARVVVELPVRRVVLPPVPVYEHEPLPGPLVAPLPIALPRRYYFVQGVSPRGRTAVPSTPVPMPLESPGSAPGAPEVVYTETTMTISWAPSPDARTATITLPPPAVVAPAPAVPPVADAAAGDVTASVVTPPVPPLPVEPPVLVAKSLGFNTLATTYHVFELAAEAAGADPLALALPKPLTPAPILVTEVVIPLLAFGTERCFEVRALDTVAGVVMQSAASPKTCVTPLDRFPPAAPKSLAAIAGAGVINLIWEPNTEADLAGYIVLRGEAPGDTLRAITPTPVRETTFRDTTVRPGVRYVYVVVAVDTADPQNVSAQSNRAEETARQ